MAAPYGAKAQEDGADTDAPQERPVVDGMTGFAVIDLASGKVLAAQKVRERFIPASVAKVPAALVILDRLGPAYTFKTEVLATGPVVNGVVQGDIILKGGADPALLHGHLEDMAQSLLTQGITGLTGQFYFDSTALPSVAAIEVRQPDTASYNPPLGGLSVDFSRFSVVWETDNAGEVGAAVGKEIPLSVLPIKLPETIPTSHHAWLPVVDPGQFAAQVFAFYAKEKGLTLPFPGALPAADAGKGKPAPGTAETTDAQDPGLTVLAVHQSAPLAAILRDAMYYSNNMALETLAMVATNTATPREAGEAITKAISEMIPNVGWGGFKMLNASGLTDQARMTPGQCAALTAYAATAEFQGMPFQELLRGRKLAPFMADDLSPTPRLRTKTGTIYYARALSGILTTQSKAQVAFCLMSNNQERREEYDAVPFDQRGRSDIRNPARNWTRAARAQEELYVLEWADKF